MSDLYYLKKLQSILNMGSKGVEHSMGIPILYQPILGLIMLVSIIFTPYVLYVLFRLKKWGWLVYFFMLMAFAFGIGQLMVLLQAVSGALIFLFLVVFMYLLRPKIDEWTALELYDLKVQQERMGTRFPSGPAGALNRGI
jgi:hypothetical protein